MGGGAVPLPRHVLNGAHDRLTVTDRWGNVAEYTLTIEQTGGSGITVPGYGFLLNNELTDFNFAPAMPDVPDPNLPGPGKRPRSSMSPTIVLDHHGRPVLAVGSPGGATIITTVTQVLLGYLDRDLPLVDAIAAPRLSSRNGASSQAEPVIVKRPAGHRADGLGSHLGQHSGDRCGHGHSPAARRAARGRRRDHSSGWRLRDGGPSGLTGSFPWAAVRSVDSSQSLVDPLTMEIAAGSVAQLDLSVRSDRDEDQARDALPGLGI